MDSDYKVYVDVTETRLRDGTLLPQSLYWEDGAYYVIDRVLDVRPAASLKAGGAGLRYTVRIQKKEVFMFLEEDRNVLRWFMERKERQ
ncbi:MAG: hypothetical protein FWC62_07505 [Firmicutes bacterium]|nr:hypothetical protein [Bacillota bacterium]